MLLIFYYFWLLSCFAQVVEKLVDVVTFIHQEISEAFGDNGTEISVALFFVLYAQGIWIDSILDEELVLVVA